MGKDTFREYRAELTMIAEGTAKLRILMTEESLSFDQVLTGWSSSPSFREFYWQTLIELGGEGCFWEHPRLNRETADLPYECVITRTKAFAAFATDQHPFSGVVDRRNTISCFINLSGSAWLIVPTPVGDEAVDCRDLVAFCRSASDELLHDFWTAIGKEVTKAIASESEFQYLSTHGLGVLWLHVRLERRPKYYHHQGYKR